MKRLQRISMDYIAVFCLCEPQPFKSFILLPYITALIGKNKHFNRYRTSFVFLSGISAESNPRTQHTALAAARAGLYFHPKQSLTTGDRAEGEA